MVKPSEHNPNEQPRLADGTYTFMRRREADVGGLGIYGGVTNPAYLDRVLGGVERHNALVTGGYVEPIALAAATDPRTRAKINEHWAQGIMIAEHTADGAGYPFPAMDEYQSDGKRTPRRAYQVDEWDMRFLGSAATVRRHAESYGKHQMEVTIQRPDGRSVAAIMLVEKVGPGNYSVTPHSGNLGPQGTEVAAAVQAVLEAKRVTSIPSHAGGLSRRAKERAAMAGAEPSARLRSTWMDSVGYEDAEGMMVTKTSTGRLYGHTVAREAFEQIASSTKPGAIFNQLIKQGQGVSRVEVSSCAKCNRVYAASKQHMCPAKPSAAPISVQRSNNVSRATAAALAMGANRVRERIAQRLAEKSA